jgi:hypothetical protein
MRLIAPLLVLILSSPVSAQETQPSAWDSHRDVASNISNAMAYGSIALDAVDSWRSEHRGWAFACQGARLGVATAAALVVKHYVHRDRPDHSDQMSFYSQHTTTAAVSSGWSLGAQIAIPLGTGYFRAAAAKHYWSDIGVGFATGVLSQHICSKDEGFPWAHAGPTLLKLK